MTAILVDRCTLGRFLTPREKELYLKEEVREMRGEPNRYFAGQKVGHSPSDEELVKQWISSNAHNRWPKLFIRKHPKVLRRIKRAQAA